MDALTTTDGSAPASSNQEGRKQQRQKPSGRIMKFQFEPNLDYQAEAVRAVVDLFEGQETFQNHFSVAPIGAQLELEQSDLGIGNRLKLLSDEILANLHTVQIRNSLKPSLSLGALNFTVEMETGTGKTYVYTRTILELNKQYGFTKFIIVVPSIAVKEGVYKSLQITKEHFKALYDNVRFDFFVYDVDKLGEVRSFATSDCVQIMVINIDAFRKSLDEDPSSESKANIIHRPHDRMMGAKPIDFIRGTKPILIIDEPQTVDTTKKSSEAIASLNPLCTFRYSATHREKHHQIFRLDSVDAFERKLVKQIEVAGITVQDSDNQAYIKLVNVDNRSGGISARIELGVNKRGTVRREIRKVRQGTDLYELSRGRELYEGYIVEDIFCEDGHEHITFTSRPEKVMLGQTIGDVNDDDLKRQQIRKTIEEHLRKELRLLPKGVKVLSLFFIDKVANYRGYDDQGGPVFGKYAVMFEEEYTKLTRRAEFASLFKDKDLQTALEGVHDGYFAIDTRKDSKGEGRYRESVGDGKASADGSVYELIMRNKERLLSFESRLRFIFSHSALREGWDNPNVFQICTLNETSSALKKRQEIGRGLRIAVSQDGERVRDEGVNVLTIMANESYEEFARQLQREIEEDTGIRFGVVEKHMFAAVPVQEAGEANPRPLGAEGSEALWNHLRDFDYIDAKGRVNDTLRRALKINDVRLPDELSAQAPIILNQLRKVAGSLHVKDASRRTLVQLNKERFLSSEFRELWDRIKYRTTFMVNFDVDRLISECATAIRNNVNVPKSHYLYTVASAEINRGGVSIVRERSRSEQFEPVAVKPPDLLSALQNETNLTRRTLAKILVRSGTLSFHFTRNPAKYIEQVARIIRARMQAFIVDGIKYHRLGNHQFYAQELFKDEELLGYLESNMVQVKERCIHEHVVYDSEIECEFAKGLNASEEVQVFAKLPSWFKIDTPLGSYNPDWAVLVKKSADDDERLFLVIETKGDALVEESLRPRELAKIKCGEAHFDALDTKVSFRALSSYTEFIGTL